MLSVGRDPANPFEVSTKNYVDATVATAKQLITNNSVWTVNGKSGNVNLTWADLIGMGGAPIMSPAFQGVPTVPSITNDNQHDWQIANTAFVQDVVSCRINGLLHAHPFVWSFNGRIGNVCLTIDDVNAALTSPGAIPITTNPPLGDASTRIATTLFVDGSVEDLRNWVEQQNFAFDQQLSLYAPLASPQFSGIPTAPTAPPATSTGQLATTAYVMAAVQAATSGVVSFNGRTGVVDLLDTDLTNAGGALLASPVFTGTPQAPTAVAGTDTAQLATCAFVLNELGGASIGVMTFNTRAGAVVLTAADITGAGGALLAGPAFTGVPTAPTAASGVATQQLATTAFVAAAIASLSIGVSSFNSRTGAVTLTTNDISAAGGAVLASPIFSGQPTAPTASPGTSTTQLATTAFVAAAIAAATGVSSFNGRGGAVTLTAADVSGVGAAMLSGATFTGNVIAPFFISAATATTGSYYFSNTGNSYLTFDGTKYGLVGGVLTTVAGNINASNGVVNGQPSITCWSTNRNTAYGMWNAPNNSLYLGPTDGSGTPTSGVYFLSLSAATLLTTATSIQVQPASGPSNIKLDDAGNEVSLSNNGSAIVCFSNAAQTTGLYCLYSGSTWSAVSDARLPYKESARKLSVLDKVGKIQLYENDDDRLELFGKAQEVYQAFPHVVDRGDDDPAYVPTGEPNARTWGMAYDRLGIIALQGVKELLAKVEALEARIAEMAARS
jgi:hypothetical protein